MKVDISFFGNTSCIKLNPEDEEEWIRLEEIIRRKRLGYKAELIMCRLDFDYISIPRYQETRSDSYRYEVN